MSFTRSQRMVVGGGCIKTLFRQQKEQPPDTRASNQHTEANSKRGIVSVPSSKKKKDKLLKYDSL